jgi:hypothetical protein
MPGAAEVVGLEVVDGPIAASASRTATASAAPPRAAATAVS